jgi:uncharacterized protein YoxC
VPIPTCNAANRPGTPNKAALAQLWVDLQQSHTAVSGPTGVTAWLASIASATAAAQAIDAARTNNAANPFKVIEQHSTHVSAATTDIKDNKLANLSSTIASFNGMWYNNASAAFDRLLDRATFVNSSIMELNAEIGGKITMMEDSLDKINSLYSGDNNLNQMPGTINSLADNLTLPDTSPLLNSLQTADQQLGNSAAELAQLIASLNDLTQALQQLQQPVTNIGSNISAYDATDDATNWATLKTSLQTAGAVVTAAANVFAAVDLGTFVTSTAGSIKGTMNSASGDISSQVTSIGEVQQSIADFSLQDFQTALDDADQAYSAFGGNPSSVSIAKGSMQY